jgi:hypothetical protein
MLHRPTKQDLIVDPPFTFMTPQKRLGDGQKLLIHICMFIDNHHAHVSCGTSVVAGLTATGRASRRKSGPAQGRRTAGLGMPLGESSWVISNSARTDQPQASDVHCKYATRRKICRPSLVRMRILLKQCGHTIL